MKKIFFLVLCLIFGFAQSNQHSKRKYEVCKANCAAGCGCDLNGFNCEHNCYNRYCRDVCMEKYNKECKACFEKSKDKSQCFDSPACKKRKECFNECSFILDVSTGKNTNQDSTSCKECFCFKEGNNEFLGKVNNPNNQCLECNLACKKAYAKFDNSCGVKGVCRSK